MKSKNGLQTIQYMKKMSIGVGVMEILGYGLIAKNVENLSTKARGV